LGSGVTVLQTKPGASSLFILEDLLLAHGTSRCLTGTWLGAAGLRLVPGGAALTRAWFVYNKPKGASYTHGGMLMGLGLTGAGFRGPFFAGNETQRVPPGLGLTEWMCVYVLQCG